VSDAFNPLAIPAPVSAPVSTSDLLAGVTSADQAKAMIESLKSDTDFGKLLLTKIDHGQVAPPEVVVAKARWDALHKAAYPAPRAYSADEIRSMPQHHDARRQAELNSAHGMRMLGEGYSPQQVHEILGGRPIPAAERDYHEQRFQTLKKDVAFMQRWSAGDHEAVLQMKLHASGRKLPVGTLEQIRAWDAAHPFTLAAVR
jgi:hypothetical protein